MIFSCAHFCSSCYAETAGTNYHYKRYSWLMQGIQECCEKAGQGQKKKVKSRFDLITISAALGD